MGFVKHSNQKGVQEGKIRYRFEIYIECKRRRKMLVLYPSTVKDEFRKWERQQFKKDTTRALSYKFFEILDEYLRHSKEIKSERAFKHEFSIINNVLKKYFHKDIMVEDIKRKHIEDFIKWRRYVCNHKYNVKKVITNATINRDLALLSYIFNYCITRDYYHDSNPVFKQKLKENNMREVRLSREQIQELLEKAEKQDARLFHTILIGLYTGMRFGEIVSLEWNEVDFNRNSIFLSKLKTKSKRARIIPIVPALKQLLLLMKNQGIKSEYVINANYNIIQIHWKKLQPQLSFAYLTDKSKFRFHDLRHIFAQYLLDEGVDMVDIQNLLGHQDVTTTQRRYAMHARPDLADKVKKIEKIIHLERVSG